MKFFDPLISVLIAGILSLVIAQEQIPSEQNLIKSPQVQRFIRYLDDHIRSKCERYGGSKAYEKADYKGSEQRFENCIESLVNITEFKAEMTAARPHGEQNIVIQNYCSRLPAFKNCLTNVTNIINPCLDPEEQQSVNILNEIISFMLEFACENGDTVDNLLTDGGIECLASKYLVIQTARCYKRIFTLSNFDDVLTIPGLGLLPKLSLDLNGCMQLQEYQRCSVAVLNECENSMAGKVVNDMLNFIKNKTSCEIVLNPQTTNSEDRNAITVEDSRAMRSVKRETNSFRKRERRSFSVDDIGSITSTIGDKVKSVSNGVKALPGIIKSVTENAAKSVSDAANAFSNIIKSKVEGVARTVSDTAKGFPDIVNSMTGNTDKFVSSSANTLLADFSNVISIISVAIFMFLQFV